MVQKNRFGNNKRRGPRNSTSEPRGLRPPPEPIERQAPPVYGKAFVVLEDEQKNTFVFKAGAWVPHSASIAECRRTCQVKELPQRVNRMIRYEIRCQEVPEN